MKKISTIWLALGIVWAVQAADENKTVYYWTDAHGVTHFSDTPVAGKQMNSKQIEIVNPPTNNPNPILSSGIDNSPQPSPNIITYTLSITSPQSEQTIRNNEGRISVQNTLSPSIDEAAQLVLYVDGDSVACNLASLSCETNNTSRGTHQLHTELIAQNGKVLASSENITVYLMRITSIK
jgi:hypothetical protein